MSSRSDKRRSDLDRLAAEVGDVDELSERVRLAGLALSAPLAGLRQGQLERETARAAARYGAEDPETLSRGAAHRAATERFDRMRFELARARVTPMVPQTGQATINGIVTRAGAPVADATVTLMAGDQRAGFVCTNAAGGFALPAPPEASLRLSVTLKEEGELYRDRNAMLLKPDQSLFRHIELEGAARPCPEPPGEPPPTDSTFPMVRLIGQLEADARRLVAAQDLVLADRKEKEDKEQAGRVVDQSPAPGAKVKAGDSVAIVVATDGQVEVPQVLGLTREDARMVLAKSDLVEGKISRKEAPPELNGRITAQSPQPRTRAARRSAVDMEVGVSRPTVATPNDDVARVASLAAHRLAGRAGEGDEPPPVEAVLARAKVRRLADLDRLLDGDRAAAREKLGLRTFAETDRLLAALRRARKEMEG